MYTITKTEDKALLLSNEDASINLKISLFEGGRVSAFNVKGEKIITDVKTSNYNENFASSILFPFANRVKQGKYYFKDKEFKLNSNEKDSQNAIHGLVYDKIFNIENSTVSSQSASVLLSYNEEEKQQGFPFKFHIKVCYVLNEKGLHTTVKVKNTDLSDFPFTIGWHPYFFSKNLERSELQFKAEKRFKNDENNITIGSEPFRATTPLVIDSGEIDDAFTWDDSVLHFKTPDYRMILKSSADKNYLQIYKPYQANIIAIEPMTGVSDSLNNDIGLRILKPNEEFQIEWSLEILK